ncbi:hypothetical protein HY029_00850 [Candidatus Gottesmanbacteria bacterium]|nr:hypothetical protein [Candidatus Gottesmanbacteria bacterium]
MKINFIRKEVRNMAIENKTFIRILFDPNRSPFVRHGVGHRIIDYLNKDPNEDRRIGRKEKFGKKVRRRLGRELVRLNGEETASSILYRGILSDIKVRGSLES